ncbi:MAG: imidazole glycerol phosphate synthase subunit HisH [Chloroflexi bacterium]|nr:imidazole glycerol phosphate synthase subunit HisH [Chloroflexota bacterium]
MSKVCILDYGSGNVRSVYNLLSSLTDEVMISNDVQRIREATHLILPGVGAFGASMVKIRKRLPLDVLEEEVFNGHKPFLGICVGLQMLAEKGYEFGEHEGLGWLPGTVNKLEPQGLPLPHIGWNDIHIACSSPLLNHLEGNADFYFVHSYVFRPARAENVLATTHYGEAFASVLGNGNIYGVQFHPEKSQKAGKLLIQNFLSLPA